MCLKPNGRKSTAPILSYRSLTLIIYIIKVHSTNSLKAEVTLYYFVLSSGQIKTHTSRRSKYLFRLLAFLFPFCTRIRSMVEHQTLVSASKNVPLLSCEAMLEAMKMPFKALPSNIRQGYFFIILARQFAFS
jgi:hypothetical protein